MCLEVFSARGTTDALGEVAAVRLQAVVAPAVADIGARRLVPGARHKIYSGKAIDISTRTVMEKRAKALSEAG